MNLDHISALSPSTGRTWRIGVCAAFLVLLTAAATVRAEQPYLIQNLPGRTTTSLGGHWDAIVDPYGTGYGSRFYESARPRDKADRVEYDFDTSDQLFVPGDWNSQRDNLFFYEGTVWYRRVFDYRPRPGTRLFVSFGAANYAARVWLNGEELGRHEGGYTPFVFEVTGKIRETGNFLVVAVEDTRKVDRVPTLSTDWWNYGGLTREVLLVETPSVFVRDYVVQLEKGSRDRIAGWVQVDGTKAPATVTVRIPEAKLEHRVTTDAAGHAVFAFDAPGLALWSPESPKLYDVEIATDSGTVRDEIGFRSIETRGADILLNGKPVFLRGICIHAEAPTRPGRAWSRDDARTLLGWAKDLGCNFVRLAHYPHDENMVREADRMGLLVWSEVPVYWAIAWEDQNALASAHQQLEEMIARDHNRASIILWSIGNETPSSDARLRFMPVACRQRARARSDAARYGRDLLVARRHADTAARGSARRVARRARLQRVHRLVRAYARGRRHRHMVVGLRQTARHERVRRRSALRQPRRRRNAVDRGVPGTALRAPDQDARPDSVPARHDAVDPQGLPLAEPIAAARPGLLES